MQKVRAFLFDNGLSILFAGLFLMFLVGQIFTGYIYNNQTLSAYGRHPQTLGQWLGSGSLLDGMFANWQAAVLQLGALIVGGAFLHQQGASHSRRTTEGGHHPSDKQVQDEKRRTSWVYRNSLSLAFLFLFLASFTLHVLMGLEAYNEQLALAHQAPLSLLQYMYSAEFWFKTFQTWEAEFVAIFLFLILTIILRQERSAESKPTNADDKDTGETNE